MIRGNKAVKARPVAALSLVTVILAVVLTLILTFNQNVRAQDFEDTIESEIDMLSEGGAGMSDDMSMDPVPSPSPKPGANAKSTPNASPSGGEPLFEEESLGAMDNGLSDSEMEPLESPFEPPAKASRSEPVAKPVSQPAEKVAPQFPVSDETESSSLSASVPVAPASDEPNSQFESRLAQIYSEHGDPVSDEKWSSLIGARAAELYSVQAGDTLWDLSRTLFADGFYWSRLWAENPEIQNPHQISKGQAIRFVGGTEAAPPEIRVVQDQPDPLIEQSNAAFDREDEVQAIQDLPLAEDKPDIDIEVAPIRAKKTESKPILGEAPVYMEDMEGRITQADLEAGVVIEQNELVRRPKIPPSDIERRPVLKDIPRSFAELRPRLPDKTVTIRRRSSVAEKVAAAIVPSHIGFERRPEPMGSVVEAEAGEYVASLGQTILIEANEPLRVGSKVYSLRESYKVAGIGFAYEVGGVIRLTELVDEKKQIYRGQVIYAVGPVRVGSDILLGEPPRVSVSTKGRRVTSKLMIAGGGEDADRTMFGDSAIVYLEAGTEGEVQVGDVLSVQAPIGQRRKTKIPEVSSPIGILKVFAVSGKMASAFVVLATSEIRKGDYTGPAFPTRLPDLVQEAPRISRAQGE